MGLTRRSIDALQRSAIVLACLCSLAAPATAKAGDDESSAAVPRDLLLDYLADRATFTLVDARSPAEYAVSHIEGAVNVPHDAPESGLDALPADRDALVVVYCKTGKRAAALRDSLAAMGYRDVRVLAAARIHWFDDMAVFNCAAEALPRSAQDALQPTSARPGEDK